MRRMMLGLSQEKLGDSLGLTFQQIQKYEKGTNRGPAFSDLRPGGDLSRQTTETPPAFLNFNRSSSLSRGSLVIQS